MEVAQYTPMYQMFVKKLDSTYVALRFNTPKVSVETLTKQFLNRLAIPQHHHIHFYFTYKGLSLSRQTEITCDDKDRTFNDVVVCYRLCGGKGGFGSLLRGAATKAGQKKTNNFDACRDMSGRRLRHVNAEKKLEEWRLEEEGRKLEKSAEEFLKKNAKNAKGKVSGTSAEKYVEKYREVSAKCVAQVEVAVREAIACGRKRKGVMEKKGDDAKRLKIWRGKKKMDDSDSDDSDNEGNGKSIVLNNGTNSDSSKEVEGGSSSVSCEKLDGEASDEGLCKSGCEEEISLTIQESLDARASISASTNNGEGTQMAEPAIHDAAEVLETEIGATEKKEEVVGQAVSISWEERNDSITTHPEANGSTESKSGTVDEKVNASTIPDVEKPLNFDEYSSAAEMEVLGMEPLKSELQSRGLKCGGTIQERAARLFLLKTTPLDKLPKKLLAKKLT